VAWNGVISADVSPELMEMVERLTAPVLSTISGRGAFS
jgi:thiamine pyrophosphate-dependent acetolactate synthase large subunit-like protein